MRLLVDESLQERLCDALRESGHDAVHVAHLRLNGAPDDAVLAAAARSERIVVTADTDFGTLLALSGAAGPSVILLRASGRRVAERARTILVVLDLVADHLLRGAVVTVEDTRIRVRTLPISAKG